jgi:diaminopimelate dehydrogenase
VTGYAGLRKKHRIRGEAGSDAPLQVAVIGPGKLGRACALALLDAPCLCLAGVVEQPGFPGYLQGRLATAKRVNHVRDLSAVDVALVCVPTLEVASVAHELLQARIPMVECARLQGVARQAHYQALHEAAHRYRTPVIYGAGWDPGVWPILSCICETLIPRGHRVQHRHPGVQLHHSSSVAALPGVQEALEGEFQGRDGALMRCVYVQLAAGAQRESVRAQIEADPLFAGEATQVFWMDPLDGMRTQDGDALQGMVLACHEEANAAHHASLVVEARFDLFQFAARAMIDAAGQVKYCTNGAHPYSFGMTCRPE